MTSTSPPSVEPARSSFICASCGKEAARVTLYQDDDGLKLDRDSFTSPLTLPLDGGDAEWIGTALLAADARTIYAHHLELACFYCPECDACYCGDHWARWNVFDDEDGFDWHDSVRGRCPQGHQRMLKD